MSRRARRPVDYYEEEEEVEEDEEEIHETPSRRRRDIGGQRFPEIDLDRRHRRTSLHETPPLPREPTPPHLVREIDDLMRMREKERDSAERVVQRARGASGVGGHVDEDEVDDVRRYNEREYLSKDDEPRVLPSHREETEEMYLRRESVPRAQSRRRRKYSRDEVSDEDRPKRREERERSPSTYRDTFNELALQDEQLQRQRWRKRSKSTGIEERAREERDDEEIVVRRRTRSPLQEAVAEKLRRWTPLSRGHDREEVRREEEDGEEEKEARNEKLLFRHRDRSPRRRLLRDDREEVLIRHRNTASPPRDDRGKARRRERDTSVPNYAEEEDDIFIRHRDRSLPPREPGQEDILIRHRERLRSMGGADRDERIPHHRGSSSSEREGNREVRIRRRERLHAHRDPVDQVREEARVRRRRSLSTEEDDDGYDDRVIRRARSGKEDDGREEILVHRSRRGRTSAAAPERDQEEILIRDEPGREKVEVRHSHEPLHSRSSHIRQVSVEDREDTGIRYGERDRRGRTEVLEKELVRRRESSSSLSESSPEAPIIRKPPIIQEVITHHRHIESYEKASALRRHSVDDTKSRAGVDEIKLQELTDRIKGFHEEEIRIENRHQDGTSPADREALSRSNSKERHPGRSKEIMILEREPEKGSIVEKGDVIIEKRKKRHTEVTKDLVVREAIERAGYDYDETDHDFRIYEYLRYDDVARLVEMTEDIRHARRERLRRERDILLPSAPPPPPPPPPPAPDSPIRETYRERDVLVEGRRPPRRRYREV